MYKLFTFKRYIEQLLMSPFVLLGKMFAIIFPLKEEYDIYFFFPGYAIGGAERVNAEIIKCFSDKKVIIFFTKNSPNDGMKHFFNHPYVTVKDIGKWTDNKFIYWGNLIYRGICSKYINSQKHQPVVFIGQCNFGYKITPHINKFIKIHELIHMYDPRFTWVWAPFVQFINTRIIVGQIFKEKFAKCYLENGIPEKYLDRLKVVFYRLEYIPNVLFDKKFELPLKLYYAGRGGPQKRIHILTKIIDKCKDLELPVQFKLAGPFSEELPSEYLKESIYVGELKGGKDIYKFHKENDILIMSSAWEGFPIVIMEAMVFGSIPLVPKIDAIPEHIMHDNNGYLIGETVNEEKMISEAIDNIIYLIQNHQKLKKISINAYNYAVDNFSEKKFIDSYRKIVLS